MTLLNELLSCGKKDLRSHRIQVLGVFRRYIVLHQSVAIFISTTDATTLTVLTYWEGNYTCRRGVVIALPA